MLSIKIIRFFACGLALLLSVSCITVPSSSKETNPLVLELVLNENKVHSIKDISGVVILTNQSDASVLVHRRLFCLPFPGPARSIEMYIAVSDSSGNLVYDEYFTSRYEWPSVDTLSVIKPGEQIEKEIYLKDGFYTGMFNKGDKYTIMVVYQNELGVTQTIDGVNVSSWVGIIRSNKETFIILP